MTSRFRSFDPYPRNQRVAKELLQRNHLNLSNVLKHRMTNIQLAQKFVDMGLLSLLETEQLTDTEVRLHSLDWATKFIHLLQHHPDVMSCIQVLLNLQEDNFKHYKGQFQSIFWELMDQQQVYVSELVAQETSMSVAAAQPRIYVTPAVDQHGEHNML